VNDNTSWVGQVVLIWPRCAGLEIAWARGSSKYSPNPKQPIISPGKIIPFAVGLGLSHQRIQRLKAHAYARYVYS